MIALKTIIGLMIILYQILGIPFAIFIVWYTIKDDVKENIMTIPLFMSIMVLLFMCYLIFFTKG